MPSFTPRLTRRHLLSVALAAPALALPAHAAPRPYALTTSGARIQFLFDLSGAPQKGTAPLSSATLNIDASDLAASTADVTADISRAKTGLIFATEAMKSEQVLHTDAFPLARFRSTRVRLGPAGRLSDGASLEGQLTLRGVTRSVRFSAALFRAKGSTSDDLSELDIRLRGTINRKDFGALGYPKLVADRVGLDISAKIRAAG